MPMPACERERMPLLIPYQPAGPSTVGAGLLWIAPTVWAHVQVLPARQQPAGGTLP